MASQSPNPEQMQLNLPETPFGNFLRQQNEEMYLIWAAPGGTPTDWGRIAAAHTALLSAHLQCPGRLTDILVCCWNCWASNDTKKVELQKDISSKQKSI